MEQGRFVEQHASMFTIISIPVPAPVPNKHPLAPGERRLVISRMTLLQTAASLLFE